VHIVSLNVVSKDAVSTDVLQMYSALKDAGYATDIFAVGTDSPCRRLVKPLGAANPSAWQPGKDVVIYHHSTGFPAGEELLRRNRGSVIVRHHNVTPPSFFSGSSHEHAVACQEGVEATRRLARLPGAVFWGDSRFNCSELIEFGASEATCRVLPPFHRIEQLALEAFDQGMLSTYKDGVTNILFVGGYKPNKGHAHAIRVFAAYHRLMNPRSRLIFAGASSPHFEPYIERLRSLAVHFGIAHRVVFCTSVSASQLRTLYFVADVFLCLSEHEGFCVPLVECMYLRIPIVAWGTTAVAETVGGCGLVWSEFDVVRLAESIDACVERPALARELRRLGYERYVSTYAPDILCRQLLRFMQEIESGGTAIASNSTTSSFAPNLGEAQ
jgi:glycosyltransferase involved in cell wall biosynthesis